MELQKELLSKETFASLRKQVIGKGVLINILSDEGFKRVFGTESNKDILILFLNQILERYFTPDKPPIVDVELQNTEQPPLNQGDKKIIYDIKCTDKSGRQFIVEIQRGESENLYNRLEYYVSRSLINQVHSGGNYDIQSSYLICIADFNSSYIPHFRSDHHYICIQDNKQYFFGGTIILIQLRKLNKKFGELKKIDEIWAYLLTNLANMESIPDTLKDCKEFKKLFDIAKLESMTPSERNAYELEIDNIIAYRLVMESTEKKAEKKGLEKGLQKGLQRGREEKKAMARKMKLRGMNLAEISEYSGLSQEEIEQL